VFSEHQNKGRPALGIEVSSLCIGNSSFDHVLMHSPTIPRLVRIPVAKQAMLCGGGECDVMVF
jgi:hypothetical protein